MPDSADQRLLDHVRPANWNCRPKPSYDLIVIGGGTAGLVSAVGAAGLGAQVALIERDLLGGDCLNVGCVPSKAILRSARAVAEVRAARGLGVGAADPVVDFPAVMQRMRDLRGHLAKNDAAARLAAAGVDVIFGAARFSDRRQIEVNGVRLKFGRAVIATGGRAAIPPIPGLVDAGYLTNETVFSLTELPRRLLVIGAGAIGCELAQAFALLGGIVTVADLAARPMANEDAEASEVVQRRLAMDGVHFELGVSIQRIDRQDGTVVARWERAGSRGDIEADAVLVAAGRTPNVEALNLPAAGVAAGRGGIKVNERLQTSNPRVFAAGDVAAPWKFTHAADATARLVIQNALFFGRRRLSSLVVPWCTYTAPEVAHVGLTAEQAGRTGTSSIRVPFHDVDRAVLDGQTDGFVRVHHSKGRILGATIVGAHAGELIAHVADVMRRRGTLGDLSGVIFPYPTYSEALREAGDAYRRTLITPGARRWLARYFAARRWWAV